MWHSQPTPYDEIWRLSLGMLAISSRDQSGAEKSMMFGGVTVVCSGVVGTYII